MLLRSHSTGEEALKSLGPKGPTPMEPSCRNVHRGAAWIGPGSQGVTLHTEQSGPEPRTSHNPHENLGVGGRCCRLLFTKDVCSEHQQSSPGPWRSCGPA